MHNNQSAVVARRAWRILRLAALWPRKGAVLKNRLMLDLSVLPKFIKNIRNYSTDYHQRGALRYGERELSFDDTPVIHIKMHRPSSLRFKMPNIPCINPQAVVDFDYDFGPDDNDHYDIYNYYNHHNEDDHIVSRKSFINSGADEEDRDDEYGGQNVSEEMNAGQGQPCDEGIDLKAEKFIAKFYEQIKLQRQISYLQYNEMISRGAN